MRAHNLLALEAQNLPALETGPRNGVNDRIPVNHPLDGPTGAFYVKGPVAGYGGLESSLKVLKLTRSMVSHVRRDSLPM